MTPLARFLFDENTGAPFVALLKRIAELDRRHPCEIGHTIELFGRAAKDREWVPKLGKSNWIVVSEDRGKNSASGDKLPVLCLQHGITHVLVLPSLLRNGGQFEKLRALLAVWPRMLDLVGTPKGSRWRLKYANSFRTQFHLERSEPGSRRGKRGKRRGRSSPPSSPSGTGTGQLSLGIDIVP
jgi:hypothetical protein